MTAFDTLDLARGFSAARNGLPFVTWETETWRAGYQLFTQGV